MTVVSFVVLAIVFLLLMSGAYIFGIACVRGKELPWLDEASLKKTPYGRFYEHITAGDTWLKEHQAREVKIKSFDGLELCALWVPAEHPRGTAMLVHGYRSCFLADFGLAFDQYYKMGFNLLLPYQRSHGKSNGICITFGVKESRDMAAWIDMHNETFGKFPMFLCGLSMGASTVMYMADMSLPENVFCLIADCGFTSPAEILAHVYRRTVHLPPVLSMWAADLFARIFAGFRLKQKDSRRSLAFSKLPIALIHGDADDFVPCYMTQQAYDACASPKELLIVKGAGHGVSYLMDKDRYSGFITNFIEKNLRSHL